MTPDQLQRSLAALADRRVLVVGDLMLDAYVWGEVSRISPDAPVPVVDVRGRSAAAGGAANVAVNILAAGGHADLAGAVGDDRQGGELVAMIRGAGIGHGGVLAHRERPTTVKTRVVARGQHVLRLDEETHAPLSPEVRTRLLQAVSDLLPRCEAILVSDYAKGVVDDALVAALADLVAASGRSIPLVVDPKSADFGRYTGCSVITPNQREAEAAARLSIGDLRDLEEASARIRRACGARWVLITRGEKGMAISGPDGSVELIPARAREVYDVTGAGDTVLAYVGLGFAAGLPAREAVEIANLAAGVGVSKAGTTVVGPAEILAAGVGSGTGEWKIVGRSEAVARVERERSLGRRIVFTNGCFDLLHAGHVHLLERAREMGDFLVVALNTDGSVRRLKGEGRPLVDEVDRAKILSALDAVGLVVLFDEETPLALIRSVRPDVLVKGGDYRTDTIVGHEFVLGYGGAVRTIPLLGGRSTTDMIENIRGVSGEPPTDAEGAGKPGPRARR